MREYFRGLKLILLFVIAAFIATSFLYFGTDTLRMGNARSNAIASVNGEEISPARFQRVQRNYIEYYAAPTSRTSRRRWRSVLVSPSR